MTPPDEDRASTGKCDADANCRHAACFQVQLEASRPQQANASRRAHRQANACAYHVADIIQALRAWAGERDLADGQLTILAIEPAAGGRQPSAATGAGVSGGFAFTTIPLASARRRDPDPAG